MREYIFVKWKILFQTKIIRNEDCILEGVFFISFIYEFVNKKGNAGINELVNARINYVTKLAGFDTFGKGWINRIKRYLIT